MLTRKLSKLGHVSFAMQPADRPVWLAEKHKQITESWVCRWEYKGQSRLLVCPPLYVYDGASVPRIAWTLTGLRPDGAIRAASVAHDILYRHDFHLITDTTHGGPATNITRREADWLFYMAMAHAGMDNIQMTIAYRAVRIGGRKYYGGTSPSDR